MPNPTDVDPVFIVRLAALAGSGEELTFERRGQGASTYPFHGKVMSLDSARGTIRLLRTRTSAGEMHEMGLRYFLNATRPTGEVLVNQVATARDDAFVKRQRIRESAVAAALAGLPPKPSDSSLRVTYAGSRKGHLEGVPADRFVFQDKEETRRKVSLVARSLDAATQFMAMQDLFLPLEAMYWYAVNGRILWPACIALSRQRNPAAWTSVDWLELYPAFDGLTKAGLGFYMERLHADRLGLRSFGSLTEFDVQAIKDRRLVLPKTQTSFQLAPPNGVSVDELRTAVSELRESIHLMRQWLRAPYDFFGQDQLERLEETS